MKRSTAVLVLVLAACGGTTVTPPVSGRRVEEPKVEPKQASPYDYTTWTAKLRDPDQSERAVTELEQLGDPRAIPALAEAWKAQAKAVRILQVIISLSRPLTAAEATAQYVIEFEKTGRPASWTVSMPVLVEALATIDVANPRSVDSAVKAADAIGESKDVSGIDALIDVASKAPSKKLLVAQIAATRALGAFRSDLRAPEALAKIIGREPPARADRESFTLHLATTGAAINAIGELRYVYAAKALVVAMYRSPELFMQIRRALVATGPTSKVELVTILHGNHNGVNALFKAKHLDQYCEAADPKQCHPVSARDFYAAVVLGDFYDTTVAEDLLAVLESPAQPVYYVDDQPSPNTSHTAVFDALRKIGSPDAAVPVHAIWSNKNRDVATRALAINAYAFLARDASAVPELGKIAADNTADDMLRQEAAIAFARLATDPKSIQVLTRLADKYLKASADKAKQAAAKGNDKALANAAKAYRGFARLFQTHVARIEIAIRCKQDVACYASALALTPDASANNVAPYIKDLADWTPDEKLGLVEANIERAMLELGKRGTQASAHTEALLGAAKSDARLVRQSILLALPKIAPVPCEVCVTRLDEAIKAGEGKVSLGDLNLETTMLRNYFVWAGRTP